MASEDRHRIWVAVRVQRGFVTDIRAYRDPAPARRTERRWRQMMNPDYDETGLACVAVDAGRRTRKAN
jgi:hypothetical protein